MPPRRGRIRPLYIAGGLLLACLLAGLGAARRHIDLVEVEGGSMSPTLRPGDWLIVEAWSYRRRPPRIGEIVVTADPRSSSRELIKRVVGVRAGRVELRGDAGEASTDSRVFGSVPIGAVRWRVAARYWPVRR